MLKNHNSQAARVMVRCLLLLWLFFGGLELVEKLQFVPETGVEDQAGQDQDEEALSELASGIKSPILIPDSPWSIGGSVSDAEAIAIASSDTLLQIMQLMLHRPPTLALYQQYSVYRI
jgi:hypothetical protein